MLGSPCGVSESTIICGRVCYTLDDVRCRAYIAGKLLLYPFSTKKVTKSHTRETTLKRSDNASGCWDQGLALLEVGSATFRRRRRERYIGL